MSLPAERGPSGQFLPGRSGNAAGRPRGSKNKVTALKLQLEEALRDDPLVPEKVRRIFHKMLDMAEAGNEKMIRLVMEKFISSARLDDVKDEGVHEYVFRVVRADPKAIDGEVVEVTVHEQEVKSDGEAEPRGYLQGQSGGGS